MKNHIMIHDGFLEQKKDTEKQRNGLIEQYTFVMISFFNCKQTRGYYENF